jgi:hypothetical protein
MVTFTDQNRAVFRYFDGERWLFGDLLAGRRRGKRQGPGGGCGYSSPGALCGRQDRNPRGAMVAKIRWVPEDVWEEVKEWAILLMALFFAGAAIVAGGLAAVYLTLLLW